MDALKLVYRANGWKAIDVAWLEKTPTGYNFRYLNNETIEFPGFPRNKTNYSAQKLWEHFTFRIPSIKKQMNDDADDWQLLKTTGGILATDRFELQQV